MTCALKELLTREEKILSDCQVSPWLKPYYIDLCNKVY